jgi:hypothetical protein
LLKKVVAFLCLKQIQVFLKLLIRNFISFLIFSIFLIFLLNRIICQMYQFIGAIFYTKLIRRSPDISDRVVICSYRWSCSQKQIAPYIKFSSMKQKRRNILLNNKCSLYMFFSLFLNESFYLLYFFKYLNSATSVSVLAWLYNP